MYARIDHVRTSHFTPLEHARTILGDGLLAHWQLPSYDEYTVSLRVHEVVASQS